MPFTTFAANTFKDDLFEYLEPILDAAEENDEELQDHAFLNLLAREAITMSKVVYVSDLISMIQKYVRDMQAQDSEVGPIVSHLYQLITLDFRHNLKFLIDSLDKDPVPKDDLMHLILSHFNDHEACNAYLIHNDNPTDAEKALLDPHGEKLVPATAASYQRLNELIEAAKASGENRLQVIIRQVQHYTAMDIDLKAGSMFIIDSSADSKELPLREFANFSPHITDVYYVNQHQYERPQHGCPSGPGGGIDVSRIQKDDFSCSVFSLEFVRLCASMMDLHDNLAARNNTSSSNNHKHEVPWHTLDPRFIGMSQSPTYRYYHAENKRQREQDEQSYDWEIDGLFGKRQREFTSLAFEMLANCEESTLRNLTSPRARSFSAAGRLSATDEEVVKLSLPGFK